MAEAQEGVSYEAVKEFIKNMSLMDAAKLVQELEEELGVSAVAPVAMAVGGAAGAAPAEQAEEKTEFSLSLDEIGSEKIKVIKVVREITALGLKEAKETVESAPKIIKEGLSKEDAEAAKKKLEEVGAKVSLK